MERDDFEWEKIREKMSEISDFFERREWNVALRVFQYPTELSMSCSHLGCHVYNHIMGWEWMSPVRNSHLCDCICENFPIFIIYFWDIILILTLLIYFPFHCFLPDDCFSYYSFYFLCASLYASLRSHFPSLESFRSKYFFSHLIRLSKEFQFSFYITHSNITISSHSNREEKKFSAIFATLNLIVQQLYLWIVSVSIWMYMYLLFDLSFLLLFFCFSTVQLFYVIIYLFKHFHLSACSFPLNIFFLFCFLLCFFIPIPTKIKNFFFLYCHYCYCYWWFLLLCVTYKCVK
jgi:hypothetical protein